MTVVSMNKKPQFTAEQFDRIALKASGRSVKSHNVARAVLVDGKSPTEAAAQYEMSKQNVSRVLREFLRIAADAPEGWVLINEYVPADLAEEVKARVALELEKLNSK